MNRFGSYLESMKLAKMLLKQAEDEIWQKRDRDALRDTIKALQSFITSINCLASLAYEPRKKHKVKKLKVRVVKVEKGKPLPLKDVFSELSDKQVNAPDSYTKILNDNQKDLLA